MARSRRHRNQTQVATDPDRKRERPARRLPETSSDSEEENARRAAAAERLGGPFVTRAWHSDGTEYTDDEYLAAGIKPPTPAEREWQNMPIEERMRLIEENAKESEPEDDEAEA